MQPFVVGPPEYIGPDGHVDSVLVGVGGFLGLGEREVKIVWSDLHVENYGEKVMAVRDGLPKFKDFPKEFGGSGDTVPE